MTSTETMIDPRSKMSQVHQPSIFIFSVNFIFTHKLQYALVCTELSPSVLILRALVSEMDSNYIMARCCIVQLSFIIQETYTIGGSIESFHWIIALTFVVRYFILNFSKSLPIVQKTPRKDVAHTKSGDAGTAS